MNKKKILIACNDCLNVSKDKYLEEMRHVRRRRKEIRDDVDSLMNVTAVNLENSESPYNFAGFHDLQRLIESSVPSLTRPFLEQDIVDIQGKTTEADQIAGVTAALINQQWSRNHIPLDIVTDIAKTAASDGTAIVMTGWENNAGKAKLVPIEEIIPDHTARQHSEVRYYIRRNLVTVGAIIDNPTFYGEQSIKSLASLAAFSGSSDYDIDPVTHYSETERLREEIEIFTIYGEIVVGGEVKDVMATFTDNHLINIIDNPYTELPFTFIPYTRNAFSIYGSGLPDLVGDLCVVRSQLLRRVIQSLDRGANRSNLMIDEQFFPTPAVKNAYEKGNPVYYRSGMNPKDSIYELADSPIASEIFKMIEDISNEIGEIAGTNRILDARALNSNVSATAANLVNSVSEQRQLVIVKNISSGLEKVFNQWLDLNEELLEETLVAYEGQRMPVTSDILFRANDFTLDIQVGTSGMKDSKKASLNAVIGLMLQAGKEVPATLYAELIRLDGLHSTADELLNTEKVTIEKLQAQLQQAQQVLEQANQAALQQEQQVSEAFQQLTEQAKGEINSRDQVIAQLQAQSDPQAMASVGLDLKAKQADINLQQAKTAEIAAKTNETNVDARNAMFSGQ